MKKILNVLVLSLISTCFFGQVPNSFKYQAVLRDTTGKLKTNTTAKIEISILKGSSSGTAVYTEVIDTVTNAFGVVNLEIGSKNASTFSKVDWAKGPYFIQIKVDNVVLSATQLLSVPYAKYAEKAGNFDADYLILKDSKGNKYSINVDTLGQLKTTKITIDTILVAYYPLNGNANDESGNSRNGILHGTTDTTGIKSFAKKFSNSFYPNHYDYIEIPNVLNPSEFSLNFWINVTDTSRAQNIFYLSNYNNWVTANFGLFVGHDGRFEIFINGLDLRTSDYSHQSLVDNKFNSTFLNSTPIELKKYINITLIYKNNSVLLYLNGVLDASYSNVNKQIGTITSKIKIGVCPIDASPYFAYPLFGALDEIRIYKRALLSSEITELYLNKK
jgi:hypothetical protein